MGYLLYNGDMEKDTLTALTVIQHEDDCPPGMLSSLASEAGVALTCVRPYLGEELPSVESMVSTSRGLIILGGGPGPLQDDRYDWLAPCRNLCLDAVEKEFPLFGICLGEELLGAALGSEITRRPKPAVGLCDVFPEPAAATDPLFTRASLNTPDKAFRAFQWHQDEVSALPAATLSGDPIVPLALDAEGRLEAFRVGEKAWGVQFHPEITPEIATRWATTSALMPSDREVGSFARDIERWRGTTGRSDAALRLLAAFLDIATGEKDVSGNEGAPPARLP